MFASCLPDLLTLGPARTIVEVVDRVAPTIERSFPMCEVIATKQDNAFAWVTELGAVDYFVAMGDLPRYVRRERSRLSAASRLPSASAERVAHWQNELAVLGRRPKIGISWRGGTEVTRQGLANDGNQRFVPIGQACNADLVCLQYGDVRQQI